LFDVRYIKSTPGSQRAYFKPSLRDSVLAGSGFQAPGAVRILLPWLTAEIEATTVLMGSNHWKQGFAENYTVLNTMCSYHYDQGLSERRLNSEELFAHETHETQLEY